MKTLRNILRVLTVALAVACVVMFFFTFVQINISQATESMNVSGAELAFGTDLIDRAPSELSGVEAIVTGKSVWYLIAILFSALTAVVAGLGFKFKKAFGVAFFFGIADSILLGVLYFRGMTHVDTGHLGNYFSITGGTMSIFALLSFLFMVGSVIIGAIAILVNDHIAVLESKGNKVSIPKRIARFFRDYKGELKKIVWPTGRTVLKNTIVVLVMCVLVGALIWLLDWGLSELVKVILKTAA